MCLKVLLRVLQLVCIKIFLFEVIILGQLNALRNFNIGISRGLKSSESAFVSHSFLAATDARDDNEQQGYGDDHDKGLRLAYSTHVVVLGKGKVILLCLLVQFKAGYAFRNLQAKTLQRWWAGRALEVGGVKNVLSITKTYGVKSGKRSKFENKIVIVLGQVNLVRKRNVGRSLHFEDISCHIPVFKPMCVSLEFNHIYEASACCKNLNCVNVTLKDGQVVVFKSHLCHWNRLL